MIESIVMQLRAQALSLKLVGGAVQFEAAKDGLTALPAAFVLPSGESAEESPWLDTLVQQRVGTEFVVVIAVRNLADAQGAAALDVLSPVRAEVRDALLNWKPDDADDGCVYRNGRLVAFANGVLWWQDIYSTAYTIRSTQ